MGLWGHVAVAAICVLAPLGYFMYRAAAARAQSASALLSIPLMQSLLRRKYPDIVVKTVSVVNVARCGDGKASTTDRILIDVDSESPAGAATPPSRLIVKINLLPWYFRLGASLTLVRMTGCVARCLRIVRLDWIVYAGVNVYNFYLHVVLLLWPPPWSER